MLASTKCMSYLQTFKNRHPDLFTYLPAGEIHPHDQLIARAILRFLPALVTPNQITLFRILATPFVFLLVMYDHYRLGVISFVLVAFTDAIDGSLARTQNKITKFGMLFDPLADKLLIGAMVLLLVFENFDPWLGVALLGVEIAFIATAAIAKYKFKTVRAANRWGKIKMLLQCIAVGLTMLALVFDVPFFLTLAAGLFGLAIGFAVVSLFAHGV